MAGLFDTCLKLFHSRCLYEVLGVRPNASANDVKKAYYKMSLKVHPDRSNAENHVLATEKFQVLGKVYSVLSDPEKRNVYDETGSVDDDIVQVRDWDAYWKLLFKNVTFEDIEKFKNKYQGSREEHSDLKENYEMFKGDMDKIMDHLPCAEMGDEPRLKEILMQCINNNEIPDYPAFTKEAKSKQEKRKKRFMKEAAEAEQLKRDLGLDKPLDSGNLVAVIAQRQATREKELNSFLDDLEAKYGNKAKKARNINDGSTSTKTGIAKPGKNVSSFKASKKKRK